MWLIYWREATSTPFATDGLRIIEQIPLLLLKKTVFSDFLRLLFCAKEYIQYTNINGSVLWTSRHVEEKQASIGVRASGHATYSK